MCVWREITVKVDQDSWDFIYGKEAKLLETKDINYVNSTVMNVNCLINNPRYLIQGRKDILSMLSNIEIKMRRHMQEKDMLLPGKNDPKFAILNR